jgi:hypothetical protein
MLFWLIVGHAVADYPLQGDFLAKAKNHAAPLPGIPWIHGLLPHAAIHAGAVALATGSPLLGCAEFAAHALIDYGKSAGWYGAPGPRSFHADQALHVASKVLWAAAAALA